MTRAPCETFVPTTWRLNKLKTRQLAGINRQAVSGSAVQRPHLNQYSTMSNTSDDARLVFSDRALLVQVSMDHHTVLGMSTRTKFNVLLRSRRFQDGLLEDEADDEVAFVLY